MAAVAAMILAAGQGTRMKSALPKVLHPLLGQPMLFYPLRLLADLGIEQPVVVVGNGREAVEAAVGAAWPGAVFAWQRQQRGTADAAAAAMEKLAAFSGPVIILCGDVPLLRTATVAALLDRHRERQAAVTVLTAVLAEAGAYGRVVVDGAGELERIVEARDATAAELAINRINSGTYCVDAAFLRRVLAAIDCQNAQGEYYLTDMVAKAREAGLPVAWLDAGDPDEIQGINDRRQLARAEQVLAGRIREQWQLAGVSISFPDQVLIEPQVRIGQDTTIEMGVVLRGRTEIGRGCHLGVGAVLSDVRLADGVRIMPYSVLEGAEVEEGCQVGPFARLRPGTVLRREVKVGNFVEVKKAELGAGSKASHLSYLGDARIGRGVNIGAGTITCNYDGFNKYQTVIEDGVFVGSDTQFVAPVTIGRDALVGAGSTITKDVPANAVATTRSRQVVYRDRGMAYRTAKKEKE
ncbi:MAG: bifunctional UDP-N-acetylglucosamine diphosphorylase/glucosamine-1-phosphate N-acetyltransferase GlmU [Deltaproteobacteria bacterium]|nr:bifunctional UDP-N-acetylglucosamine diphosphorylase/glucosamine-1-phosphate N-acetyltransferase GlmU [Deltaproteobacteria bacterium]